MNVLVHATAPYPVVMWDLLARELNALDHTAIWPEAKYHCGLDCIVSITFQGFTTAVIAKGPDDVQLSNEVLSMLLKHHLVEYHSTRDLKDRLQGATPMVCLQLPASISRNDLPLWAHAIALGVYHFLLRVKRSRYN